MKKGLNLEFGLSSAYATPYSVHLGATKMYKDLKESFWWPSMKGDMVKFV